MLCRYNALATLPEEGEEEGEEAASVVSHTPTEDEGWGPSLEEIDAAVREVSTNNLQHAAFQHLILYKTHRCF